MPDITMPKLSDTMTEGTLVAWKKKKGDAVAAGEVLAEIETDKATMEWESPDDGVLTEVYVKEGEKVPVGTAIGCVLGKGEKPSSGTKAAPPSQAETQPAKAPAAAKQAAPAVPHLAISPPPAAPPATSAAPAGRVKASPLARKIAAATGVDLSRVTGTGPGSRILQRDVLAAPKGGAAPAAAAPGLASALPVIAPPATPDSKRIPLSGMRKTIADRLLASKTQIPHFYLNIEVNAAELMKLRASINASNEKSGGPKLTVNDFVLKAAVVAVTRVPKVNAAFDRDAIVEYGNVNLAVAVAIDDGLVTPVIREAQKKSIREISEAVKDLAGRARSKKLKPEEYQGGTITISNLGSYGIDSFSAIINPPQAVILSIGAVVKKPVVNEKNEIVVGQRMWVGMSCDHRVVDGAIGSQYLAEFKALIENPTLMFI